MPFYKHEHCTIVQLTPWSSMLDKPGFVHYMLILREQIHLWKHDSTIATPDRCSLEEVDLEHELPIMRAMRRWEPYLVTTSQEDFLYLPSMQFNLHNRDVLEAVHTAISLGNHALW